MPKRPSSAPSRTSHKAKRAKPSPAANPVFAQPQPTADPTGFRTPVTDQSDKEIDAVEPVPQPRGNAVEPVLTLQQVYGPQGSAKMQAIAASGQIVFHCAGDTGSVKGPTTEDLVSDKLVTDFKEANPADVPSFFFHLGDVVYYFGEAAYYYDQFYDSFRNYPAPIIAIPGNHDGVVWSGDSAPSLQAFLRNF
ncbi:MAG TPA: metallophosphoesterase, partial [Acidobacteriaceae bacterium]